MRTVLLAALAALTLSAGSPALADSPTRDMLGGCGFLSSMEPRPGDTAGTLYVAAVVYSAADPAANPVTATVTCEIRVDGVAVASLVTTGTGVVAAMDDSLVVVGEGIEYQACTTVVYDNGETDGPGCEPDTVSIPPGGLGDIGALDPVVCPALGDLAPGLPGIVDVTAEGDVYLVAYGFLWDCPPYQAEPTPPDPGSRQHVGHCRWMPAIEGTHPMTADGWWGHLYTATVVYSATEPAANPVSATVTCSLRGVASEGGPFTFAGTGVVAGVSPPFRYFGENTIQPEICTRVAYDDGTVDERCVTPSRTQLPPQEVIDLLDDVLTVADPVVCPLIGSLAPGVPGVLDVSPGGNVAVLGGWLWDCPPYGA